jgi:hypothetical protein
VKNVEFCGWQVSVKWESPLSLVAYVRSKAGPEQGYTNSVTANSSGTYVCTQYVYLLPDGKTLIIRSVTRKFGFVLAQITEQFEKY